MADEQKSFLASVMEPFIMGAKGDIAQLRGDLETKGLLGTIGGIADEVARSGAMGATGMSTLKIPAVNSLMFGKLPEVTPIGSFVQHPAVQIRGGDLISALAELIRQGRSGNLPK